MNARLYDRAAARTKALRDKAEALRDEADRIEKARMGESQTEEGPAAPEAAAPEVPSGRPESLPPDAQAFASEESRLSGDGARSEPYRSATRRNASSFSPSGLAGAQRAALEDMARDVMREEKAASVDDYVAKSLGWTEEQLSERLTPEQTDGVAMALWNMKRGTAFLNRDDASIGKDAMIAAVMIHARRRSLVPVFLSAGKGRKEAVEKALTALGEPESKSLKDAVFVHPSALEKPGSIARETLRKLSESGEALFVMEDAVPSHPVELDAKTGRPELTAWGFVERVSAGRPTYHSLPPDTPIDLLTLPNSILRRTRTGQSVSGMQESLAKGSSPLRALTSMALSRGGHSLMRSADAAHWEKPDMLAPLRMLSMKVAVEEFRDPEGEGSALSEAERKAVRSLEEYPTIGRIRALPEGLARKVEDAASNLFRSMRTDPEAYGLAPDIPSLDLQARSIEAIRIASGSGRPGETAAPLILHRVSISPRPDVPSAKDVISEIARSRG